MTSRWKGTNCGFHKCVTSYSYQWLSSFTIAELLIKKGYIVFVPKCHYDGK